MDEGRWSLVVPPGVAFVSTSLGTSLQLVGDRLILSPLVVYAQKGIIFTITMRVLPTASGRLVFHSFLNDPDTYCEKYLGIRQRRLASREFKIKMNIQAKTLLCFRYFTR